MQLSVLITELEEFMFICPNVKVVNNARSCGMPELLHTNLQNILETVVTVP